MCCNRQLYLRKLQVKIVNKTENLTNKVKTEDSMDLSEMPEEEEFDIKKLALETSTLTKIHFAETAAEQKNFPVAVKTVKEIYKVSKLLEQDMWSRFIQCYCRINNKRCHSLPEKLDILLNSWKQLSELEIKCGTSVSSKNLQSQTLEFIGEMFMKNEISLSSVKKESREAVIKLCGSSEKVAPFLLEKSFLCLKEVLNLKNSNETTYSEKSAASAHMALANFCNKYMSKDEDTDDSTSSIPSSDTFPDVLIDSLLTALEYGVADAFFLFPRLLQIIEVYPFSLPKFKEKVSKMPCWLFIGWINQMVALLDKPEASAVHGIIEKIAVTYPDAIIYTFHLSCENYNFTETNEGKANKFFVEKIKSILSKHALITDFVEALEQLSVPEVIFKDYIGDFGHLISTGASTQEINSAFVSMVNNLFNVDEKNAFRRVPLGPMQCEFAKDFKSKVLDACGKNGQKLSSAKASERLAVLKKLTSIASEAMELAKKTKCTKLKDFSPWLNDFQPWKYPSQIEIPGQYTGRSKPLPEYHIKVSGFDENVMVLSSITLPRRITIRGNDEKEYKILVKAGEDLRQDARIQQVFSVMNEIYRNDIACAKRHLTVKTYKVIPITNRLGLIEWVDNTVVLQGFLMDGMSEGDKQTFMKRFGSNAAKEKFFHWVKKIEFKNFSELYTRLYKEKRREECVKKFEEIVNTVPRNLLMNSFLKLSSCPEAFVALRTRFATSHAVICISQWILGIGDRHLGNFLVDKNSGYEIGIDFGHAFGSATQFLQVPELMPFRLTSQYLQLLDPLKVKGIYEATMVHALSALQSKKDLLLAVMDIFIKEPTLDWKVHARKQEQEWEQNTTGDDWFPKQRIALAHKKLEGFNPCHITREELVLGHRSKECFQFMESVCLGSKEYNIRAKYGASGLTPEEQVECLIDQATDPHLLCLAYCGWNSWM